MTLLTSGENSIDQQIISCFVDDERQTIQYTETATVNSEPHVWETEQIPPAQAGGAIEELSSGRSWYPLNTRELHLSRADDTPDHSNQLFCHDLLQVWGTLPVLYLWALYLCCLLTAFFNCPKFTWQIFFYHISVLFSWLTDPYTVCLHFAHLCISALHVYRKRVFIHKIDT